MADAETLPERLAAAVEPIRYTVQQTSPGCFVCQGKGRYALMRVSPPEWSKLHIRLQQGSAYLIGPAMLVNKVRKSLLVGPRLGTEGGEEGNVCAK
jgi:hypothetical protein